MIETLSEYPEDRSPGIDSLTYEFYKSMPGLFEHILTEVYANWQQNGKILISASGVVVTLIRKDLSKGDIIINFRL